MTTATTVAEPIYKPAFFEPEKAYENYTPDLIGAYREGVEYALENGLKSAQALIKAGVKNAAMLTDLQEDFRESGNLPVQGTDDVCLRVSTRIINGTVTDYYSGLIYSQDGHPRHHVSFDYNWRDYQGKPLDLREHGNAAMMTLLDRDKAVFKCIGFDGKGGTVDLGMYQPKFDPKDIVAYWDHLQATGQGDIWVFVPHCMLGTTGSNLHPLIDESVQFLAGARSLMPKPVFKGFLANTDWFGPLVPCRPDTKHAQGEFQSEIVEYFETFDNIEFAGVAEDFCDYWMKKQTFDNLSNTEYAEKLAFMTDGTAPIIPNAAHVAELNEQARKDGVRFIEHNSPMA